MTFSKLFTIYGAAVAKNLTSVIFANRGEIELSGRVDGRVAHSSRSLA
jgi:hypothetical protein